MNELRKVLNTLQPTLSDNGTTFTFQKIDSENVLITSENGRQHIHITATVTQLQQILNRMDEWEKLPCERSKSGRS